jgi:hypothetical protein
VENTLYGYAKLYLKNRYIQVNDHNVECVRKMKGTLMPVKQRICENKVKNIIIGMISSNQSGL